MHQAATAYAFPRTYRPTGMWRFIFVLLGLAAVAGGAGIWLTSRATAANGSAFAVLTATGLAFVIMGIYLLLYTMRANVVLRQDAIDVTGFLNTRTMARQEIAGYRLQQGQNGPPTIVLVPRLDGARKLKIPNMFGFDGVFNEWLCGLPNLDQQDEEQVVREIAENEKLGASPRERERSVAAARLICRVLLGITIGLSLWIWVYPVPYWLLPTALVLLPWIAVVVVARYPGLVVINQKKRDPHPGVGIPFIMPGLVLAARSFTDFYLLDWKRPLELAILVSAALVFAALKADPILRKQRLVWLLLLTLSTGYGYATSMLANTVLDRSAEQIYIAKITRKYVSGGRSNSYHLILAPWKMKPGGDNIMVSRQFYGRVHANNEICLGVRQGSLGIPWYFITQCR